MPIDPDKFADFDCLIAESKRNGVKAVVIHHPQILDDNYEELVANFDKLATAGLLLQIIPLVDRIGANRN